jgi:hypothetical protein
MRKLPVVSVVLAGAALAVAACGGTAASNVPTIPPLPSGVTLPSLPVAIPTLPGSFAIPSNLFPSFDSNADPTLAAKFPTQVGGQPVTDIQTVNFISFFQAFSEGDAYATARLQAFVGLLGSNGIDASQLSFGSGRATVNGDSVEVQAFRTPGSDAAKFVGLWPQLSAIDNNGEAAPTIGTASVGGKNVTTFTTTDESVTYVYPSGDTVWSVDDSDPTVAAAVFQAIQ